MGTDDLKADPDEMVVEGDKKDPRVPSEVIGEVTGSRLEEETEDLVARADRLLSNWQRSQADFSNFRKQVEQEKEAFAQMANASLLMGILPVLDDLQRALETVAPQIRNLTWVDGVWLIHQKLLAIMNGFGLEKIQSVGEKFDPRFHESVSEEEGEDGQIVSVLQEGYTVRGRLIRPALVTVGKSSIEPVHAQEIDREDSGDPNQEAPAG